MLPNIPQCTKQPPPPPTKNHPAPKVKVSTSRNLGQSPPGLGSASLCRAGESSSAVRGRAPGSRRSRRRVEEQPPGFRRSRKRKGSSPGPGARAGAWGAAPELAAVPRAGRGAAPRLSAARRGVGGGGPAGRPLGGGPGAPRGRPGCRCAGSAAPRLLGAQGGPGRRRPRGLRGNGGGAVVGAGPARPQAPAPRLRANLGAGSGLSSRGSEEMEEPRPTSPLAALLPVTLTCPRLHLLFSPGCLLRRPGHIWRNTFQNCRPTGKVRRAGGEGNSGAPSALAVREAPEPKPAAARDSRWQVGAPRRPPHGVAGDPNRSPYL
ncbi:hypothetical protein VULLAG_LOCUS6928 [Vulpes lagopus]